MTNNQLSNLRVRWQKPGGGVRQTPSPNSLLRVTLKLPVISHNTLNTPPPPKKNQILIEEAGRGKRDVKGGKKTFEHLHLLLQLIQP